MKTLYIRNILRDLWKARWGTAAFVTLCVVMAVCLALRPGTPANLSDEQKEELALYNEQIEGYESSIKELEKGIEDNEKQVADLQGYVDNSIYMRIDPNQIQTATVQYGLQTGGNVGNILNSFVTYINDGGLRESVEEPDRDLQPEYWRDIISCYINSNILNITVIHYDAEQCARIMEIVKRRVMEHVPEVTAVQGDFTLVEMESTQFVKADAGIFNTQNGHRNNLKNYKTGLADLQNRLVSYRTNKANYIKNNEPSFAEKTEESQSHRILKYALAGAFMGFVAACALVLLRYILSDRLRSAADLKGSGLNVIGLRRVRKPESRKPEFIPAPERAAMDVCALAEAQGKAAVFLDLLHDDEPCGETAEAYAAALAGSGMRVARGRHVTDSVEEIKQMIGSGSCLLFAEAGKTTYQELKKHMELCERFKVAVLGCVVVE